MGTEGGTEAVSVWRNMLILRISECVCVCVCVCVGWIRCMSEPLFTCINSCVLAL